MTKNLSNKVRQVAESIGLHGKIKPHMYQTWEEIHTRMENDQCLYCGKKMKNGIDTFTKKVSEHLFYCDCPNWPKGTQLMKG